MKIILQAPYLRSILALCLDRLVPLRRGFRRRAEDVDIVFFAFEQGTMITINWSRSERLLSEAAANLKRQTAALSYPYGTRTVSQ